MVNIKRVRGVNEEMRGSCSLENTEGLDSGAVVLAQSAWDELISHGTPRFVADTQRKGSMADRC